MPRQAQTPRLPSDAEIQAALASTCKGFGCRAQSMIRDDVSVYCSICGCVALDFEECDAHNDAKSRAAKIRALLSQLSEQVDSLEQKSSENPYNWGYAGALGRIQMKLEELLSDD